MGAAGLTSSSVEMAGKGGLGIELDLDQVPVRETGMTAYEIMLSESQERMLMILRPAARPRRAASSRNGNSISRSSARSPRPAGWCCSMHGEVAADIPVGPLVDRGAALPAPMAAAPMPSPTSTPHP